MLNCETKLDDFSEERNSDLQKFIEYAKAESKRVREEARKELMG
jgi:hypothetical protein